jgi:hypothetical protein
MNKTKIVKKFRKKLRNGTVTPNEKLRQELTKLRSKRSRIAFQIRKINCQLAALNKG